MDGPPYYVIQTRQDCELLFGPPQDEKGNTVQVPPGETVTIPAREVDGYSRVRLFGVGNVAYTVRVFEACSCDGPFVLVNTITSTTVGPNELVNSEITPIGPFMQLTIENTGGTPLTLQFCGRGLPIS